MFKKKSESKRPFCLYHFTESRPLSIPMRVMPDTTASESWTTSEERMKELIGNAWDAVKQLTLQVPSLIVCFNAYEFLTFLTLHLCHSLVMVKSSSLCGHSHVASRGFC